MKRHTYSTIVVLVVLLLQTTMAKAQYGIAVYDKNKDTLCINNINLDNIKHDIDKVSFICKDTTMMRNISDVDNIEIMKIPDVMVINQGLGDWSEMRLCNDGSVFVTKMMDDETPSEMMMMCPDDSLGAVVSKVVFDDYGDPVNITINEYRLLVEWLGENQFNLTLLTPDSIAIRYDNLSFTIDSQYAGLRHVPDIGKKGGLTKLGGVLEMVAGGLSTYGGVVLIAGGVATGGVVAIPAIALGALTIADGINSMYKGYTNAFTEDYVPNEWVRQNGSFLSQAITSILGNYLTKKDLEFLIDQFEQRFGEMAFKPDSKQSLASDILSLLGQILIEMDKPYTWFDLYNDIPNYISTDYADNITCNSASVYGYVDPYILASPSVKFQTEYGMFVYSATNKEENYIQKIVNGEGGTIEYQINKLKPCTTYNYYTYYKDKTNNIYCNATEESFTTLAVMPEITDFKVTKAQYSKGAFTHEGKTYDYRYDVAVTVKIDDDYGVDDWGYVYLDPNGRDKRISLKSFGSPYTDRRYAYFRNSPNDYAILYGYVKYKSEKDTIYGDMNYYDLMYEGPTAHTNYANATQNSATVSCSYYNVPENGICGVEYSSGDNTQRKSIGHYDGTTDITLNNLTPQTTYTYKAYVEVDGEITYGEEKQFTTGHETPDLTGTWKCTIYYDEPEVVTITLHPDGKAEGMLDEGNWSCSYEEGAYYASITFSRWGPTVRGWYSFGGIVDSLESPSMIEGTINYSTENGFSQSDWGTWRCVLTKQ